MKQRSSSFQISDILGLPPKDNGSGDDASSHPHTAIPPASISSALHSSNNHYNFISSCPAKPSAPTEPPCRPPFNAPQYPLVVDSPPNQPPPPPNNQQIRSHSFGLATHTLTDSKPSTGGYLPGNLNSSMFLESSAAAAAHHYNNLFHGRNWHLDNSGDHYGE